MAIATELGRETLKVGEPGETSDNREHVLVAVDELGQLWIRYSGPRGLVDRHLPMPARSEQIPLVVSLSVGNLVRQEAFELLRDIERGRAERTAAAAAPTAKPAAPAVAPQPALPRGKAPRPLQQRAAPKNSWGHYLVGDLGYVASSSRACASNNQGRCYDADWQRVSSETAISGVAGGIAPGQGRYLMAYSRALTPELRVSARVGFAFSGGREKNAAADHDAAQAKFMPWLFDARLQAFPFRGAFDGALRPFFHVAAGVSEVSTATKTTLSPESSADGSVEKVTLVNAMGLLFAGAGAGGSLTLFDPLRLEAELSGFVAFPSSGWFVRPGAGLVYDF